MISQQWPFIGTSEHARRGRFFARGSGTHPMLKLSDDAVPNLVAVYDRAGAVVAVSHRVDGVVEVEDAGAGIQQVDAEAVPVRGVRGLARARRTLVHHKGHVLGGGGMRGT